MSVRPFDKRFVDDASGALRALPRDKAPLWGRMSAPQMVAHMCTALKYSLNIEAPSPPENAFLGAILAPLILNAWIKIPKNSKAPRMYDVAPPEAEAEELIGLLAQFEAQLGDPAFRPQPHTFFGNIGKAGWSKLHVVHLDHHLRQFAAAPRNFLTG